MDAAHARGLVHRDVKPGNVLLDRTAQGEHAYLTDFGLTKQTGTESGLTRMGSFMGTPAYMAPEQIEGQEVDGRADQYSLACMAFELLTGAVPFSRDQEFAVAMAHVRDRPPPADQPPSGAASRGRCRLRPGDGQGPRGPLRDLHRLRRRPPLGARRRGGRPLGRSPPSSDAGPPCSSAAALGIGLVAVGGLALASGLLGGSGSPVTLGIGSPRGRADRGANADQLPHPGSVDLPEHRGGGACSQSYRRT